MENRDHNPLSELFSQQAGPDAMRIGRARTDLLREIERETLLETGRPAHPPPPRLTFAVLAAAATVFIVIALLIVGVIPRPH